jgi:hypothetical protein
MSDALNVVSSLSAGDVLVISQNSTTRYRGVEVADLQAYLQANLTFTGELTKVFSAPSATGTTVSAFPNGATTTDQNVWLVITPLAGYAAMTITLPAVGGLVDMQEVSVNCTQSVTTLTISANGATGVIGAPTTLAANAYFTLRYDAVTKNWYRVD